MHRAKYGRTMITLGHFLHVRLLQLLRLVHQLHFDTLGIGSVLSTLGIIPKWDLVHLVYFGTLYVWYTGWYTKSVGSRFVSKPYTKQLFGTLGSFLVILGTIDTVVAR